MKTLFSPVGTADPISQLGDGPMLHIVRHYQPEKVVLFLSPSMAGFQSKDQRYTKAIELLCETEGRFFPEIQLVASPTEEVYRFDIFINEFEPILQSFSDEDPKGKILVNVSSGTPGMSQALVALGSFARIPLTMLQVTSPRKGINAHDDREDPESYDLDTLWELNEELRVSDPSARESRIVQVETPNFSARLMRENVSTLLEKYDYEAAFELACRSNGFDESVVRMVKAARDRLNLDQSLPAAAFSKAALSSPALAYRTNDGNLEEYLSVMRVRLDQGHWGDFMRLLTPPLTRLAKEALTIDGVPEKKYLKEDGKLNWDAICQDAELERVLDPRGQRPTFINNEQLIRLVDHYCTSDESRKKFDALRDAEKNCRNLLAHELQCSSKDRLEERALLSLEDIMQHLFDLYDQVYKGRNLSARRDLYAGINKMIVARL